LPSGRNRKVHRSPWRFLQKYSDRDPPVPQSSKNILYPPGGILIWIILSVELLTFIPGLLVFLAARRADLEAFRSSAAELSTLAGVLNTCLLITSGWLMALALTAARAGRGKTARRFLTGTILTGIAFLIVKAAEYYAKLNAGYDLRYDSFFTYYWLLTGFHYAHVFVGVVILLFMLRVLKRDSLPSEDMLNLEAGGVFWHMCDLIWVLVFPVFYLL
jgi:nitric oxide reductase NorE protein